MTLTEVKTKLQEKKVEYTIAVLVTLSTLLFGVIWWGWLYGLLARTMVAVPRRVLGAIIGILAIWLIASMTLAVLYARDLKALKIKSKALSSLPVSVGLKQALAQLRAFNDNLPRQGDVEEKFVTEYHGILTRIEKETDHNLDDFRIAADEVDHRFMTIPGGINPSSYSGRRRPSSIGPSQKRYCDREVFLMRLHGVINFLK